MSGYAESVGESSIVGAVMISAAMMGNITAKFLVGVLSDCIGAVKSAFVLIGAFTIGISLLCLFQNLEFMLLGGSFVLGTSYACALMLSNITFEIYGTKQYGEAFSILTIILNIGGSIAIAIVGYGYDIFGTYSVIMCSGIVMSVLSVLLLFKISKKIKLL